MLGAVMLYTSGTTGRPKGVRRKPGADRPTVGAASARVCVRLGRVALLCAGPLYHAAPFAYLGRPTTEAWAWC